MYSLQDLTDQTQLYIRDSVGNKRRLTYFPYSSGAKAINEKGEVMITANYYVNPQRYLYTPNSDSLLFISTPVGKAIYSNSAWYVIIGNCLYKVNTGSVLPVTLLSFSGVQKGKDNLLSWQTSEEVKHQLLRNRNAVQTVSTSLPLVMQRL